MTFSDLGLSEETLKAVEEAGYNDPTPIQQQAIPVALMGRDILGVAQTGTGKTASFTLPMIDILASGRAKARMPRSLILAPTRELAAQVAESFEKYGKYHRLNMALLIGGESMGDQITALDRGVDVLIATPGRLIDMFDRGRILLNDVKILVIDEADRMLDMGFIPDVERIVSLLPKIRQTLFFSATMPPEVRRLADAFLMNPKPISVAPPASPAALVVQQLLVVEDIDKRETLRHLLRTEDVRNALIFCNRKRDVDVLFRSLTKHGFSAARLHGDMAQSSRTETLEKFKQGDAKLMVCSDVAARGIDIKELSHVFNFDVPIHAEDYVHRIGRTGRAGREGRAFTLATPYDGKHVAAIEKMMGSPIPRLLLEGMTELELSMEDGRRHRGRRDEKPERKGRDRRKDKEPRAEKAEASAEPRAVEAPREERPAREERPHREERRRDDRPRREEPPHREERREVPAQQAPAQQVHGHQVHAHHGRDERRDDRPRDRRERRRRFDEFGIGEMRHSDGVIGFGDHVPDFILRPVVLPPRKAETAMDEDEADLEIEAEIEEVEEIDTEVEEIGAEVEEIGGAEGWSEPEAVEAESSEPEEAAMEADAALETQAEVGGDVDANAGETGLGVSETATPDAPAPETETGTEADAQIRAEAGTGEE